MPRTLLIKITRGCPTKQTTHKTNKIRSFRYFAVFWCVTVYCLSWLFVLHFGAISRPLSVIVALITKTYLYNFDPLKPHFYILKLGFTGVYIIFLIPAQKHILWVLVRNRLNEAVLTSTHNVCFEQKYGNIKGVFFCIAFFFFIFFFLSQNFQFLEVKFSIYSNRRVFIMPDIFYPIFVLRLFTPRKVKIKTPLRWSTGDVLRLICSCYQSSPLFERIWTCASSKYINQTEQHVVCSVSLLSNFASMAI